MAPSLTAVFEEAQIVVVGAGVIGCSTAYHLARRGADVLVLDASGIGTGTSSATLGLVWVQRKEPAEYMELNLLSSQLHAELARVFDEDVELNQPGGITSYTDEAAYLKQIGIMEKLNADSPKHQARALSGREAHALEPELSPDIVGAIYCPHDGEINPMKLNWNLARSARKLGVRFVLNTPVQGIRGGANGVQGVDTAQGFVRAKTVVVAAGMGTPRLAATIGLELPMVFEKGQLLVTEALRRFLLHPTGNTRQTKHGNILLGTTYEANQAERTLSRAGARTILDNLLCRYPGLKDVQIIRHFAGVRPLPKDGKPYLGPVKRCPGLYVATSHSGITLAPVHGKVISELIVDGKTEVAIDLYQPERVRTDPSRRPN